MSDDVEHIVPVRFPPDLAACPNCGRFAWVLVSVAYVSGEHVIPAAFNNEVPDRLLWACPCGEFRWTSYAEWADRELADLGREQPVGSLGQKMTPKKWGQFRDRMP